jgi:cystathionine beta-lyase/cystathionine gamma-synthase
MAAIAALLLAETRAGDRVLVQRDAYGGTIALLAQDFARFGVSVVPVDAYDPAAVKAALPAAIVLVETISNPLVRETDVRALAATGARIVADNTFATPILQRPLGEGASIVVHSATKFLGGHHDLCAGVVCGDAELCARVRGVTRRFGFVCAPFEAWLASRGLRTLAVRIERAQATARVLVARLRETGRAVHYPGRGALFSVEARDPHAAVRAFRLITLTPSLGGTTTTVSHSATSSHRGFTPVERAALGISDGLLRVSVGLEDVDDLWSDLGAIA